MKNSETMGAETPGDQKIAVTVRAWNGMKLAVWRAKIALSIVEREATTILGECEHVPGCPGATSETAPCSGALAMDAIVGEEEGVRTSVHGAPCPDREQRMSALVILNAARPFLDTVQVAKPDSTYFAPSREYFSEVLANLAAAEIQVSLLSKILHEKFGVDVATLLAESTPVKETA